MCYEAGPNGFALKRRLEAMGPVVVEVVAPTLTARQVGRRVKTDAIDARKLAKMFRGGELTPVTPPNEGEESARDLVRTYHQVTVEATRKRHHLLKFAVRRGRIYRKGEHWTQTHRAWLASQTWEHWQDEVSFTELRWGRGSVVRVVGALGGWSSAGGLIRTSGEELQGAGE